MVSYFSFHPFELDTEDYLFLQTVAEADEQLTSQEKDQIISKYFEMVYNRRIDDE